MNHTTLVNCIAKYAMLGWTVYPVQPVEAGVCTCTKGAACPAPGKHPFFGLGGIRAASSNLSTLQATFGEVVANAGLQCGTDFWVLDVDGPAGLRALHELVEVHGELPLTPTAETGGGGRHYLFRHDARIRNRTRIGGVPLDTKAQGGMIVVPPSRHVSGGEYHWMVEPESVALADAPEWLIAFVTETSSTAPASTSGDWDLRTAPGASEGARNSTLCRLVGIHLFQRGNSPDLLQLALGWGQRCEPPLPDQEVVKVLDSLVGRHLAKQHEVSGAFDRLTATPFAEIEPRPVDWLWPGRLARGKLTLLTGDGGVGKSILTCDLAARISQGKPLPDGFPCSAGDVFFIGAEDGAEDTIRPRLDAAGAYVKRVHFIGGPKSAGNEYSTPIDLSIHLEKLDHLLSRYTDASLLVVDPIMDYLGDQTNSDKAPDVRRILGPLRSLAERHNVTVILTNHLNKSAKGPKSRSLGSGAFNHVCRVELRVVEDPADPSRRLLLQVKNNLAATAGLAYRIEPAANNAGIAKWESAPVLTTIDEIDAGDGSEVRGAMAEASAWLESKMGEGPMRASEIHTAARQDGISHSTLKRSKAKLGIGALQRDRQWWWVPKDWDQDVQAETPAGSTEPEGATGTGANGGSQSMLDEDVSAEPDERFVF